jgi:tetratricopeptide (TPR) repeat protein
MNIENRRKQKRVQAPKGMLAGWKTLGQSSVSRVQNIGLGGAYLAALKPPAMGSSVELILSLASGDVRARAVVRRSTIGKGMGVQFVQMRPEDRARLNKFLLQAPGVPSAVPPVVTKQLLLAEFNHSAFPPSHRFEQELAQLIDSAGREDYYQLLGVARDSTSDEIKRRYRALAKKFHPDFHMDKHQITESLKDLMEKFTHAYQSLYDRDKRTAYDQKLMAAGEFNLGRSKAHSHETIEEWTSRAQECLRAKNFVGSITWLRKCVDLMPDSGKHQFLLARSLGTVPVYKDEAIFHFERSIELEPCNTDAYFYFGEFYDALKLPWRAQPLYAKILEINPEHAGARQKLSR